MLSWAEILLHILQGITPNRAVIGLNKYFLRWQIYLVDMDQGSLERQAYVEERTMYASRGSIVKKLSNFISSSDNFVKKRRDTAKWNNRPFAYTIVKSEGVGKNLQTVSIGELSLEVAKGFIPIARSNPE